MTSAINNCYMYEQFNLFETFSIFIMFHYCAVHFNSKETFIHIITYHPAMFSNEDRKR